ncbi:MAG: hypothetical protein FJY65_08710 [Calditrichaeota bacterium]|nr:hypothetical protein [Calditrichota bacterium]
MTEKTEISHFIRRPYHIGGGWFKIYDAALPIMSLVVHSAGLFHRRLGAALKGRRSGMNGWRIDQMDERPAILLHTASRGEFEGALPLIERLNATGLCRLAVSYSSPSVANLVANTPGLWASGYLPLDFFDRQLRLLARLEPNIILINKHDFWPNTLRAAAVLNIPVILINANFHSASRRAKPLIKQFSRRYMRFLKAVWTVSEEDASRAEEYIDRDVELHFVGDTRYDQTLSRARQGAERFAGLKTALGGGPVLIAGSTWPPEERMLWTVFADIQRADATAKLIIAPHELTPESQRRVFASAVEHRLTVKAFSAWRGEIIDEPVLFVDKMGVLAQIYAVGYAALVGGGFGKGVHSVLEPAANSLPTTFGPRCHNSHEAGLLIKAGGGFIIHNQADLYKLWNGWLVDNSSYKTASTQALGVVIARAGATARLLERIIPYLTK